MLCAYVHWTVFLGGQGFLGQGVARRVRGPRSHPIGEKLLAEPNRKEPRFGHRTPHLDSSDWWAGTPPARPHWVPRVRGEARLACSCFPSPARRQRGEKAARPARGLVGGSAARLEV